MQVDAVVTAPPVWAGVHAAEAEAAGFDGIVVPEAAHDAFITLTRAATSTERIRLGTSVAIAFARSPMNTAYLAHDLQQLSGGRFELGLGPQIQSHIRGRFDMPWSQPAARMREYVLALRAIWRTWNEGERLDFDGELYRFDRMSPMFDPGPSETVPPPIHLAAVGPRMTAVAAEVADGLIAHPMSTPEYLRSVIVPALESVPGRDRPAELTAWVMVATGPDDETVENATALLRHQVAFYGSTPAYRPMLEQHGYGDLQPALQRLFRSGDTAAMHRLVDDDVLSTFGVVGDMASVGTQLRERYHGLVDRLCVSLMSGAAAATIAPVLHDLRSR